MLFAWIVSLYPSSIYYWDFNFFPLHLNELFVFSRRDLFNSFIWSKFSLKPLFYFFVLLFCYFSLYEIHFSLLVDPTHTLIDPSLFQFLHGVSSLIRTFIFISSHLLLSKLAFIYNHSVNIYRVFIINLEHFVDMQNQNFCLCGAYIVDW